MKKDDDNVSLGSVVLIGGFIASFIGLRLFAAFHPEHEFVRMFLTGGRFWIAVLVPFIVMGWIAAIKDGAVGKGGYRRRSKRSDFK